MFRTDIAKAFGNALREARKAAGMSQEALSLSSGIDRTFVSMLERGVSQPALSTIVSLAKPLGIAPGRSLEEPKRYCAALISSQGRDKQCPKNEPA